ncbi:acyl-CoA thioesterase domain-containing protein [Nocardia thailandica]
MTSAYFHLDPHDRHLLLPQPTAGSGWGKSHLRGMAVSGALARAAESAVATLGFAELRPTRWTLDMYRPALAVPSRTVTTVHKAGPRLCLIDTELVQDDRTVARATTLLLGAGKTPEGAVWHGSAAPTVPTAEVASHGERLYFTDATGWTTPAGARNASRNQVWHSPVPIVEGEPVSPFQFAASVADVANLVANFGDNGLEFINPDLTLALTRLPRAGEMGLAATARIERDGVSVGTVAAFDRAGVFGTVTVCGLANAERAPDLRAFGAHDAPQS